MKFLISTILGLLLASTIVAGEYFNALDRYSRGDHLIRNENQYPDFIDDYIVDNSSDSYYTQPSQTPFLDDNKIYKPEPIRPIYKPQPIRPTQGSYLNNSANNNFNNGDRYDHSNNKNYYNRDEDLGYNRDSLRNLNQNHVNNSVNGNFNCNKNSFSRATKYMDNLNNSFCDNRINNYNNNNFNNGFNNNKTQISCDLSSNLNRNYANNSGNTNFNNGHHDYNYINQNHVNNGRININVGTYKNPKIDDANKKRFFINSNRIPQTNNNDSNTNNAVNHPKLKFVNITFNNGNNYESEDVDDNFDISLNAKLSNNNKNAVHISISNEILREDRPLNITPMGNNDTKNENTSDLSSVSDIIEISDDEIELEVPKNVKEKSTNNKKRKDKPIFNKKESQKNQGQKKRIKSEDISFSSRLRLPRECKIQKDYEFLNQGYHAYEVKVSEFENKAIRIGADYQVDEAILNEVDQEDDFGTGELVYIPGQDDEIDLCALGHNDAAKSNFIFKDNDWVVPKKSEINKPRALNPITEKAPAKKKKEKSNGQDAIDAGIDYLYGADDVKQDIKKAKYFFLEAQELGHKDADTWLEKYRKYKDKNLKKTKDAKKKPRIKKLMAKSVENANHNYCNEIFP